MTSYSYIPVGLSAIAGVAIGASAVTSGLRWGLTSAVRTTLDLRAILILNRDRLGKNIRKALNKRCVFRRYCPGAVRSLRMQGLQHNQLHKTTAAAANPTTDSATTAAASKGSDLQDGGGRQDVYVPIGRSGVLQCAVWERGQPGCEQLLLQRTVAGLLPGVLGLSVDLCPLLRLFFRVRCAASNL